jgi:hypothetical protein
MNVEIFTLCESATVENGAVSITRTTELAPLIDGAADVDLALVCVVRFFPDEEGPHMVRVRFEDSDGASVLETPPQTFTIDLQSLTFDSWRYIQQFRLKFTLRGGEHRCTLFVDETERISIPFYVE